jgi:simple sugar transport system permease protein
VAGSRVTGAAPLALALAAGTALLLFRTPFGLRLRAVGEAPLAARAAGLPDVRLRLAAFALSGGLAGLAGGLEVAALTGRLYDPFSAGVGYSGIAAALLGGLHPIGATLAALLFAALGAGAGAVQRDAGVPAALATLLQAVAVLALLWAKGRSR